MHARLRCSEYPPKFERELIAPEINRAYEPAIRVRMTALKRSLAAARKPDTSRETSVSKYLVRDRKPPSQTWRTFSRGASLAVPRLLQEVCKCLFLCFEIGGRSVLPPELFSVPHNPG
jgi:hypothetical protein